MIDTDLIARAKAVLIERVIEQHGIKLRGRVEREGPCPICGGVDRFSINTKKQVFNCRGCDIGGGVITLVMHLDGVGFASAVAMLTSKNSRRDVGERQRWPAKRDDPPMLAIAERVWNEAGPLITPALDYLAMRGISLDDVPEEGGLRWHHACPWGSGTEPCIIARYTDAVNDEPKGIWRRPVTGEKPKTLGPMAGCVIRLWPNETVAEGLVVGEGVETVLAAATRIEHKGTLLQPAWAAGGTSNLKGFPILAGIEALTILVDHDANGAGQLAAERCAQRWLEAGREVIQLRPADLGADFNDLIKP